MVGWTLLLGVFGIMLLFALSVVVTSRRMQTNDDYDELE